MKDRLKLPLISVLVGTIMAMILGPTRFAYLSYDLPTVLMRPSPPAEAVIVGMDIPSCQRLDQPDDMLWDRGIHASLVEKLREANADLTVFDLLFESPSDPVADDLLGQAIGENGRVILASRLVDLSRTGVKGEKLVEAIPVLATNALAKGLAQVHEHQVQRRVFTGVQNHASLALSAARYAKAGNHLTLDSEGAGDHGWIRWYGPPGAVHIISYSDALETPLAFFHDKIVFVGANIEATVARSVDDRYATPHTLWGGGKTAGVEVIATMCLNLLRAEWIKRCPFWQDLALFALAGFLILAVFSTLTFRWATTVTIALSVAAAAAGFVCWNTWNLWVPWAQISFVQLPVGVFALGIGTLTRRRTDPVISQSDPPPVSSTAPSKAPSNPYGIEQYMLLREIGKGAYGITHLCQDALGNYLALKVILRDKFDSEVPFERELTGLKNYLPLSRNHEHLLKVFHVGVNEKEGNFYYVMELADGEEPSISPVEQSYRPRTLGSDIRNKREFTVNECVDLAVELAQALDYLHTHRLIHRDIKPDNIIYVKGRPKLADIGMVASLDATEISVLGTIEYMDRETCATALGDLYSLGKTLEKVFTLATGPDVSSNAALRLNTVLSKATAPKPQRYQNAAELLADLRQINSGC
jgi:CHASE2 domain-containing sensor protein